MRIAIVPALNEAAGRPGTLNALHTATEGLRDRTSQVEVGRRGAFHPWGARGPRTGGRPLRLVVNRVRPDCGVVHSRTAPGRPSWMRKDARVEIELPGRVTYSSTW